MTGSLKGVDSEQKDAQKEKEAAESEYGKCHKETVSVQRERKQVETELSKKRPEIIERENQVKHLKTAIEADSKSLDQKLKDLEASKRKVQQWSDQLHLVQADRDKLAKVIAEKEGGFNLLESQMKEYNQLKQEAGRQSAEIQTDLDRISREEQGDSGYLRMVDTKIEELQNRVKQLEEEVEQSWGQRKEARLAAIKDLEKRSTELETQLTKSRQSVKDADQRSDALKTKLAEAEEELGEAKFDKRTNEREQRFLDTLEALKRHFPGVHGRMLDLCQPSKNRYNVAVTVAMGANMDAIIVEDDKTAMDCVQYLKEQRSGIATFLPLESIKPSRLNEALRQQHTLVIDVINFDPRYQPAVLYAVGNTLLCDTLEDAKRACFGPNRQKAVTLDGTVINKNGFMTGGVSGVEIKARRWDQKKVEHLKRTRERLTAELVDVTRLLKGRAEEEQLNAALATLQVELRVQGADLDFVNAKIKEKKAEIDSANKQVGILKRSRQTHIEKATKSQKVIDDLKAKLNAVEEDVFREFSKRMKVPNIQVYQQTLLKDAQANHEKNTQLAKAESQLGEQISYETAHNQRTQAEADVIKKKISTDEAQLKEATQQSAERAKEGAALQKKVDTLKKRENDLRDQEKLVEARIKDIRKQLSAVVEKSNAIKGEISILEGEIERFRNQAAGLFEQADREGMKIGGQGQGEERLDDVDFSSIPRQLRGPTSGREREKISTQFREQITQLSNQVAQLTPNMKAAERLGDVEQKVGDMNQSFEAARSEAQTMSQDFQRIKALRFKMFMDCFTHLEKHIDEVYRLLAVGSLDAFQGLAWIMAEPWEEGIKYSATPPNKRFRDMDQLSGGERIIAALALLFALHSYRPAPFFVLDEIDAPLDPEHVRKVVNYLRVRSEDTQFVVISLKEAFYRHADGLIGIYKNLGRAEVFSGVVTLDLSKYPPE